MVVGNRWLVLSACWEAEKPRSFGPVAPVFLAEGLFEVSLFYREVQTVDEKEEAYEHQRFDGPACERDSEQREQPAGDLRVSAVAVGAALDELACLSPDICSKERNSRTPAASKAVPERAVAVPRTAAGFRPTGSRFEGFRAARTVSPACER